MSRSLRYLPSLILAIILVATLGVAPARLAHAATTLTVTTTADLAPPCTTAAFSLHCAIAQANADGAGDTIAFHIPASAPGCKSATIQGQGVVVCTLTLGINGLPALSAANTTIDGYTQAGARPNTNTISAGDNAILTIVLDGGSGSGGLDLRGPGESVRGLALINAGTAIHVEAAGATISGNFIGVRPDGTPQVAAPFLQVGIWLDAGSGSATIGGSTPATVNVISAFSTSADVAVFVSAGGGDVIAGNYVGTNPAGTASRNNANGVQIFGGTGHNTIGGSSAAARNVIAGTLQSAGVSIDAGSGNVVEGNYIGTNAAGTAALSNGFGGIDINDGPMGGGTATNTVIGGTSAAARNVISGNAGLDGVRLNGSGTVVEGNFIGTDATGTAALGNGTGVEIVGSQNLVGGSTPGAGNVISGNAGTGLLISNGSANVVAGNTIGLNAAGNAAVANATGVAISPGDGGRVFNNLIGGSTTGARNVIAGNTTDGLVISAFPPEGIEHGNGVAGNVIGFNGDNGVFLASGAVGDTLGGNVIEHNALSGVLVGASSTDVTHEALTRNAIFANGGFANGGLGIDLAPQGVVNCATAPPGPNDYTPCPVMTTATTTTVSGTACAACTVEVFVATNEPDDQGHGEGAVFVGSAVAAAGGSWSLTVPAGRLTAGQRVTATATTRATTSIPAETSEFAANVVVGS